MTAYQGMGRRVRRFDHGLAAYIMAVCLLIAPQPARAGVFDNISPIKLVHELWERDTDALDRHEKAVLVAAHKMGNIRFCRGRNAFLIKYKGRPAVTTSAHMLINGDDRLKCSMEKLARQAEYFQTQATTIPGTPKRTSNSIRGLLARKCRRSILNAQRKL